MIGVFAQAENVKNLKNLGYLHVKLLARFDDLSNHNENRLLMKQFQMSQATRASPSMQCTSAAPKAQAT